ncbi:hypothetical protein CLOM_g15025 [Closterium sp. NIES-68]|nr:hypothetical protein CLOM_g15025 [Closterium sp. NIES-68]
MSTAAAESMLADTARITASRRGSNTVPGSRRRVAIGIAVSARRSLPRRRSSCALCSIRSPAERRRPWSPGGESSPVDSAPPISAASSPPSTPVGDSSARRGGTKGAVARSPKDAGTTGGGRLLGQPPTDASRGAGSQRGGTSADRAFSGYGSTRGATCGWCGTRRAAEGKFGGGCADGGGGGSCWLFWSSGGTAVWWRRMCRHLLRREMRLLLMLGVVLVR